MVVDGTPALGRLLTLPVLIQRPSFSFVYLPESHETLEPHSFLREGAIFGPWSSLGGEAICPPVVLQSEIRCLGGRLISRFIKEEEP